MSQQINNPTTFVGNYIGMIKVPQVSNTSYLIRQLPTPTAFVDTNYNIVQTSDKWTSIFNENEECDNSRSLFAVFPNLSEKWKMVLENCFKGNPQPMGIHKTIDTKNNELWFEWINAPWYDTNENIVGAIIQLNNITDAVSNELELNKKDLLLQQQAEITKIGRWEYNIVDNQLFWCSTTKAIHEVPEHFSPNIETALFYYKEGHSRNAISMALFEAQDKGKPWSNLKLQIITTTGKEKWVMAGGKPIFNKGEMVGLIGTFQDIHEQVEADIKIINNEKLLRTLIDNLPVNVYIKDTESRKILINKAECEYLGVNDPKEIIGKSDFELYPYEAAEKSREEDLEVMNTLKPVIGKETVKTTIDGKQTSFLSSKIPLLNNKGFAYGLVGISLDISKLKEKEKELRNIINIASVQNKKLLNFAHIVSHNLRSHSANFSMLLNFLETEKDEGEKKNIISMLTTASNNLLETLDNLNEVVSINTNTNIAIKEINLNNKVIDLCDNLSPFIAINSGKIENNIPDNFNIKSVPAYLDSILTNFITNAIKYKHPDREALVILSAEKKGGYSILTITDNGLGIDLDKYGKKLFGMYNTFHEHKDARGIGLYLTKNQIDAMNGKVEVTSETGKGTEFKIFFNDKN
ncbi:PAS domain-containing sensor histidine kinase [uncultured Maribacter sp.]|uniref:PAS domain-containing sensor histidine kinase n=1 Tax=uncultured Maribacter sp. TaxID=431308 RepID=UPI00261D93CD|nr:PAS domain-containing sensor histidine kinase [uncultured Maribacter sp.]